MLLGIGAKLAAPENSMDGNRIIIAVRDSLQDSVNQVGQEMTRRNLDIQPTLTERPGQPVRITSTATWHCGRTSHCSSKGDHHDEHEQAATGAAAQIRNYQVDLHLSGLRRR